MHLRMVSWLMYMCLVESVSTQPVPPSWQASQALGAKALSLSLKVAMRDCYVHVFVALRLCASSMIALRRCSA